MTREILDVSFPQSTSDEGGRTVTFFGGTTIEGSAAATKVKFLKKLLTTRTVLRRLEASLWFAFKIHDGVDGSTTMQWYTLHLEWCPIELDTRAKVSASARGSIHMNM